MALPGVQTGFPSFPIRSLYRSSAMILRLGPGIAGLTGAFASPGPQPGNRHDRAPAPSAVRRERFKVELLRGAARIGLGCEPSGAREGGRVASRGAGGAAPAAAIRSIGVGADDLAQVARAQGPPGLQADRVLD